MRSLLDCQNDIRPPLGSQEGGIRRTLRMHKLGAQSFRLAMAMMAVAISTSPAHAYLDPGAASIALQVLLGGIAGMALAIKLYWHKFLSLIGMGKTPAGEQSTL